MSILDLRWPKKKPKPQPPLIEVVPVGHQPFRVTEDSDGTAINRGYSYYPASFVEPSGSILTFCGIVGKRPQWFRVGLDNSITRLGALVAYDGEAEGWWFTPTGDLMLCEGPRLKRVNPFSGLDVVVLDVSQTHPGCRLWQSHVSDDGLTQSATVERIVSDGPYERVGTIVANAGERRFFGPEGYLDESQITPDGHWLIIKELEVPGDYNTLYNRVISLDDWSEYRLSPSERIGHSDCGPGFVIGEDSNRGWCAKLDLATRERIKLLGTWAMGGVSYRGGRCLRSSATALSLVAIDGTGETHLVDHGMVGDPTDYEFQCRASLDPTGRAASYVSNAAGRMDLYLVRLP